MDLSGVGFVGQSQQVVVRRDQRILLEVRIRPWWIRPSQMITRCHLDDAPNMKVTSFSTDSVTDMSKLH